MCACIYACTHSTQTVGSLCVRVCASVCVCIYVVVHGCLPLSPPRLPSDGRQARADLVTDVTLPHLSHNTLQMAAPRVAISFQLATGVGACMVVAHAHPKISIKGVCTTSLGSLSVSHRWEHIVNCHISRRHC